MALKLFPRIMKSWFDWKSHHPSLVFGRKCNEEANIEAPMFRIPKHTTSSQVVVARRKLADISYLDGVDVRLPLALPLLLCSCVRFHFRVNQSNSGRECWWYFPPSGLLACP